MRRLGTTSFLAIALLAILGAGSLASSTATPVRVKVGSAQPGGRVAVSVKLLSVKSVKNLWSVKFRATATVHFPSGDVTRTLQSVKGTRGLLSVKFRVAADEQPGDVPVDVTVTLGSRVYKLSGTATVQASDNDSDNDSDPAGDGGGDGDGGGGDPGSN